MLTANLKKTWKKWDKFSIKTLKKIGIKQSQKSCLNRGWDQIKSSQELPGGLNHKKRKCSLGSFQEQYMWKMQSTANKWIISLPNTCITILSILTHTNKWVKWKLKFWKWLTVLFPKNEPMELLLVAALRASSCRYMPIKTTFHKKPSRICTKTVI
jgi:hypothetical protein